MGKNLLDLSKLLKKTFKKIKTSHNEFIKDVAYSMVEYLVNETPVDTSNALSNWQVGIAAPVDNEIDPYYWGEYGSTQMESAEAALERAAIVLDGKKPGETIYLSNVADYVSDLNRGSSEQHPGGFVEAAVSFGNEMIRNFKGKKG